MQYFILTKTITTIFCQAICLLEFTQSVPSFTLTATTNNECGPYTFSKTIGNSSCPTCPKIASGVIDYTFSPNPASAEVSVEVLDNAGSSSGVASATEPTYTVQITDMSGNPAYNGKKKGKKFNLSVSSLKNGVYNVTVSDGEKTGQGKLVVKH